MIYRKQVLSLSSHACHCTANPTEERLKNVFNFFILNLQKIVFNFSIFCKVHLKQLGNVEEAVAHEEAEIAPDLGEQGQLGVADKLRGHLNTEVLHHWEFRCYYNMFTFRGELGIYYLDIPPEVENHLSRVVPRICGALRKEKMSF